MYRNYKNIRVVATRTGDQSTANIYLDLSGQRQFVTTLRMSAPLCGMLGGGMRMEDLKRWNGRSYQKNCPGRYVRKGKLKHAVAHVIRIIDDYITYELEDPAAHRGAASARGLRRHARRHQPQR